MNRASISDLYRKKTDDMQGEIRRESEATIIGTNPEELAEYYCDKYCLPEIQIVKGPELEIVQDVVDIPANQRDEWYTDEGPLRNFPIKRGVIRTWIDDFPNFRNFWPLLTSTFTVSYSLDNYIIDQNCIGVGFDIKAYNLELNDEQVVQRVTSEVERINQQIEWKNNDIKKHNAELRQAALNEINARKEQIIKNESLLESVSKKISIPLVKRHATEPIQPIIQVKKEVKKLKPEARLVEEYELDQKKVLEIVKFIDSYMKALERTPKSVSSLGEEELRDLLLAHLNEVFDGAATGETFSKKGKTDIYLRIDKGNILIFECKIWGGKQLLFSTIDQIRGYLTWRHNFGVIIFFARNKNFTQVRDSLADEIVNSESYINGFQQIDSTHFVAKHNLEDDKKSVEMHYLIYNLYSDGSEAGGKK